MPILKLGTRTYEVCEALRAKITSGEWAVGEQIPGYAALAVQFGVSPVTVRQALAFLVGAGVLVSRQGVGTFVQHPKGRSVLVVDDEKLMRQLLGAHVQSAGFPCIEAAGPSEALAILNSDPSVALVFSDVRMPAPADGVRFIRTVRRKWPSLPVAVVAGRTSDLDEILGTEDCPTLVIAKPFFSGQILDVLRQAIPAGPLVSEQASSPRYP